MTQQLGTDALAVLCLVVFMLSILWCLCCGLSLLFLRIRPWWCYADSNFHALTATCNLATLLQNYSLLGVKQNDMVVISDPIVLPDYLFPFLFSFENLKVSWYWWKGWLIRAFWRQNAGQEDGMGTPEWWGRLFNLISVASTSTLYWLFHQSFVLSFLP